MRLRVPPERRFSGFTSKACKDRVELVFDEVVEIDQVAHLARVQRDHMGDEHHIEASEPRGTLRNTPASMPSATIASK